MANATGFAYAGARLQARYAGRPTASTWSHFARIGDFGHLVQTVRGAGLGPWVADLGADTGAHGIEARLRDRYRREVHEVARWLPADWEAAGAWFAWIPDLAALAHLRRRRPAWPWMDDDAVARALGGHGGPRPPGLADFAALLDAPADRGTVADLWLASWRRRWPGTRTRRGRAPLEPLQRHLRALLGLDAAADRTGAEHGLRRTFRRHTREPAGAFAYLALLYIQFRRLRGLLLQRRLFPV